MANLTIAVDDALLHQARVRAVQEGTSVNQILREQLERYARQTSRYVELTDRIIRQAKASQTGHRGKRWTREELHERR